MPHVGLYFAADTMQVGWGVLDIRRKWEITINWNYDQLILNFG